MKFEEKLFLEKYRGMDSFLIEGKEYFDYFKQLLENEELLEKIRFANDVLGTPPLYTFIVYVRDFLGEDKFNSELSKCIKQGLGACFGYLYRFIYTNYEPVQCWINDKKTGIKTASKFIKL